MSKMTLSQSVFGQSFALNLMSIPWCFTRRIDSQSARSTASNTSKWNGKNHKKSHWIMDMVGRNSISTSKTIIRDSRCYFPRRKIGAHELWNGNLVRLRLFGISPLADPSVLSCCYCALKILNIAIETNVFIYASPCVRSNPAFSYRNVLLHSYLAHAIHCRVTFIQLRTRITIYLCDGVRMAAARNNRWWEILWWSTLYDRKVNVAGFSGGKMILCINFPRISTERSSFGDIAETVSVASTIIFISCAITVSSKNVARQILPGEISPYYF